MITILGGGIAGVALARALAIRGGHNVVVFDPRPIAAGSTGQAMGGFRTQFASRLNIALAVAARPFFVERAEHIHWSPRGHGNVLRRSAPGEPSNRNGGPDVVRLLRHEYAAVSPRRFPCPSPLWPAGPRSLRLRAFQSSKTHSFQRHDGYHPST